MLDLGDHLAAETLGREHRIEDLELHGLLGGGEIAHLVANGPADEHGVDRHRAVEHVLLAVDLDDLRDVLELAGALVHLSALDARVDEGAEADLAHLAREAAGHRTIELGDLALREAVGLDLVVGDHVHPARLEAPMRADDTLDQALVREMLNAALTVGLTAGMQQGDVAGMSGLQETTLDCLEIGLGCGDEGHGDGRDGRAVLDRCRSLLGRHKVCLDHRVFSFIWSITNARTAARSGLSPTVWGM